MSDKESVDGKEVANEDVINEENIIKGKKRKRPAIKPTPKKKVKSEEPPAPENNKDTTETEEDEEMPVGLLDRSPVLPTGTRIRKQVERLNINSPAALESPDRRKNEMLPGKGLKLGTSPKILSQLQNVKQSDMTLLHRLLFKRPGTAHEIKKNIREFSGYPFDKKDKEFESRKHMLEKNNLADLKFICQIMCLEKSGTKEGIIERILEFCLCPNPSIKPIVKKKKNKAKESKKKGNAKNDGEKIVRSSPKKNVTSNETIEDDSSNSSEEAEDTEDESSESETSPEPTPVKKTAKKSSAAKGNKEASETKSQKKPPKKSPKKTEIKIKLPPLNKAKKKLEAIESTESEGEEDKKSADTSADKSIDDEKSTKELSLSPKKSPANNEKPTKTYLKSQTPAKISKSETTNDELTDTILTDTIKQIINDANLEDMTMKNLCRQVYDKFPEYELEKTRKEFIRSTAKKILGNE